MLCDTGLNLCQEFWINIQWDIHWDEDKIRNINALYEVLAATSSRQTPLHRLYDQFGIKVESDSDPARKHIDLACAIFGQDTPDRCQFYKFCALTDLKTPHELYRPSGLHRLAAIYRRYDRSLKGFLTAADIRVLLRDLRGIDPTRYKNICLLKMERDLLELGTSVYHQPDDEIGLDYQGFINAVQRGIIKGTSRLLRVDFSKVNWGYLSSQLEAGPSISALSVEPARKSLHAAMTSSSFCLELGSPPPRRVTDQWEGLSSTSLQLMSCLSQRGRRKSSVICANGATVIDKPAPVHPQTSDRPAFKSSSCGTPSVSPPQLGYAPTLDRAFESPLEKSAVFSTPVTPLIDPVDAAEGLPTLSDICSLPPGLVSDAPGPVDESPQLAKTESCGVSVEKSKIRIEEGLENLGKKRVQSDETVNSMVIDRHNGGGSLHKRSYSETDHHTIYTISTKAEEDEDNETASAVSPSGQRGSNLAVESTFDITLVSQALQESLLRFASHPVILRRQLPDWRKYWISVHRAATLSASLSEPYLDQEIAFGKAEEFFLKHVLEYISKLNLLKMSSCVPILSVSPPDNEAAEYYKLHQHLREGLHIVSTTTSIDSDISNQIAEDETLVETTKHILTLFYFSIDAMASAISESICRYQLTQGLHYTSGRLDHVKHGVSTVLWYHIFTKVSTSMPQNSVYTPTIDNLIAAFLSNPLHSYEEVDQLLVNYCQHFNISVLQLLLHWFLAEQSLDFV